MPLSEIESIIETGSYNSKERLSEAINALHQRAKKCRERVSVGTMSIVGAANEINACNKWIECFAELKNSL